MTGMPEQLYLLGNVIIMVAYAAIVVAIVIPVTRAGQLRTNKLAVATALIFFSCAIGHGLHALMTYRALMHADRMAMDTVNWPSAAWDAFTAVVGVYYWSLRRGYGILLGNGAMYFDPASQHQLDQAGLRERAAREAAENHRAVLATVVEHTEDAIIGVALDGSVTAWNGGAERLFGYPAAEMIGNSVSILATPADNAEQLDVIGRASAGRRGFSYEARRVHKDGSPLEISVNASAIRDRTGTVVGLSIVARDIAAEKEAADRRRAVEERTHQAQRMESLGKLAGGVAHDFNNILAIIANYTEFAVEQSAGNPAVQEDLAHVRTAADRAINLTRQLLTFTRGDTIQPQDVDLHAAVAEVHAMLGRTLGEHIALIAVPPAEPLCVHADPGQIQQVLLNLAINARDAMPEGGTLVIEANTATLDGQELNMQPPLPAGPYARLVVSDTGDGMSAETAARIFEPFYTTKPRGQGTGLGLSTVYGIVVEAGGAINVYSEPGLGTTFRVYLPLAAGAVGTATAPVRQADPLPGAGRTVLVVEDEPALTRVVARILANGGYHVLATTSGLEALDLDREQRCDLLLTDVIMPAMSGRRLADLLHERRPGLPVLFMSGYSNGLLGTTHVLDPGIAFIEKPFTGHDLLLKVGEVLGAVHPPQRRPASPTSAG
jgi:PAS domain S-box-containing protein